LTLYTENGYHLLIFRQKELKMKFLYLFFIIVIIAMNAVFILGQNAGEEFNKTEFGAGYSRQQADSAGINSDSGFNGFDVSVTRNFTRYFGIKGDFSGAYKGGNFTVSGIGSAIQFKVNSSIYNYLGGVQFKDNKSSKGLKPFFHALAGGATLRQKVDDVCLNDVTSLCPSYDFSSTKFAAAFGGGLDVRVSNRISVRVIQADYNPIFVDGGVSNNFRIGAGIVFH
jgi:opacity protein-like surface antigen